MTGQPDMSTDALREFFLPLEKWLKKENKKNGVKVGWDHDDSKVMCSDQTSGQTTDQPSTTSQTGQNTRKIVITGETPIYILFHCSSVPGFSYLLASFSYFLASFSYFVASFCYFLEF